MPAGADFSASDIVLGGERRSLPVQRHGTTVMASAFSLYTVGQAVQLYYELYGLTTGGSYRTKVSLRRAGDTRFASSLSFTDHASGSTMASSRSLTLNNVKPGEYDLIVAVDEVSTRRQVVRQRTITVEKASVPETR